MHFYKQYSVVYLQTRLDAIPEQTYCCQLKETHYRPWQILFMATYLLLLYICVIYLAFLDPPGPPEIHMHNDGSETIRMGQTVTLTCISHGGNPLAQIFWFKNGDQVDMSFTTSGRQSRNAYTFVATADDNNAKFRCEAKNEMNRGGVPMTAEVTIPVQVTIFFHISI